MKKAMLVTLSFLAIGASASANTLAQTALELLKKLPESGYDSRTICIVGDQVTGIVPMTHWSKNDRKIATGTLDFFPSSIQPGKADIQTGGDSQLIAGDDSFSGQFYSVSGFVNGQAADICVVEMKAVLESLPGAQ